MVRRTVQLRRTEAGRRYDRNILTVVRAVHSLKTWICSCLLPDPFILCVLQDHYKQTRTDDEIRVERVYCITSLGYLD